jgi:hypothetical protein
LAFGATAPTYMSVGTELNFPARIINVQNLTDQSMLFSFDGVVDHFILPSGGFILLDVTGNRTITTGFFIAEGTQLFVKWANPDGPAPQSGGVYFSAFHSEL